MHTTSNIDDLYDQASLLTGVGEKTTLIREALKALIERESSKHLSQLGGCEPQIEYVIRRQADTIK